MSEWPRMGLFSCPKGVLVMNNEQVESKAEPEGETNETTEETSNETTEAEPTDAVKSAEEEVARWKSFARKHEDRVKALQKENVDLTARLEQVEKATARVAELEAALEAEKAKSERAVLVAEVSASKGVKPRYLLGSTREELEASADEFLTDVAAARPVPVGVVPSQGTGTGSRASSFQAGVERARAQREKEMKAR